MIKRFPKPSLSPQQAERVFRSVSRRKSLIAKSDDVAKLRGIKPNLAIKKKFSIVIALAPWRSAEILTHIKNMDYPSGKFEVIVIKGLNVPDNRNQGVKKSKGEIVVFLDDDAVIEKDFLKNLEKFFNSHPQIDIVGGPQLSPDDEPWFARISGYALEDIFGTFDVRKRYSKSVLNLNANSTYITGANFTVRKKVFDVLDFDLSLYPADDVHFINMAKKKGFKIAYNPEMVVYHRRRANLKGLAKQVFDYGKVRPQTDFVGRIIKKPFFLVPSFFLLYLVFLPTLLLISRLFLLPLLAYFALDVVFSAYESFKHKSLLALVLLPFIFFIIHVTYGAGVLIGLVRRGFKV
ncbi:MAG: glycosyltransferase [Nanoarchaeota archaeon]|nr:glycosyltransferase [Nanoarchaeota archaeon]